MRRQKLPVGDYSLRVLASVLMFVSAFMLIAGSTFALRMRNDIPPIVPGLTGPQGLALLLALALAFVPLLFRQRYLTALTASGLVSAGIGGYWWTRIPWDELITDSGFPSATPPGLLDYLLVASPAIVIGFYAGASQWSRLRVDLLNRGAEPHEATRAAAASFLTAAGVLVVTGALAMGLWLLMATGFVFRLAAPVPVGVPALVLAAALLAVAYALLSDRINLSRLRSPSSPEAPNEAQERTRGRKSPS